MYSFDVFDTLITRNTATPWGIFALMREKLCRERGRNGLDDWVADNFYELRVHGEELARKAGTFRQKEEVTLGDIYEAVSLCGCISREQSEYLYRLELETETASAVGIPWNIRKLKELAGQGERVVLVSDMYLPEEAIREMLVRADAFLGTLPLYVSAAYGRRKTTGNLYHTVREKEQTEFPEWTHVGDNLHQDIAVPLRLGMGTEFCRKVEMTGLEKRLVEHYGDDSRLQLLVGSALVTEGDGRHPVAYHVGCRYAGPVLYSYAEWIVDRAASKGLKRLYFIARDGWLVKKIVDIILHERQTDIKTAYIYGSRKAWRMPSLSREHYNLYQLILWSHVCRINTLDELAGVLHVPLDGLYAFLPGTYASDRQDRGISNQELEYIAARLSSDVRFREYHLRELAEERELARRYLEQELDLTDDHFAFVDVSGGGLTQGCLGELLGDMYRKPIHTFFFKVDRVNLAKNSVTDTFLPCFLESNLTVEMMCRAPHGQTEGYAVENGRAVPVLGRTEAEPLVRHGFYEYERGILDFAGRMCRVCADTGIRAASARTVLQYLEHIAGNPPRDVLEFFASMPSSESGRDGVLTEYAPKLTREEIRNLFLVRTCEPVENYYRGTDLNYSVLRAEGEERELIESCRRERNGPLGIMYRQQAEGKWKDMPRRYGRAAFYPVRLLERRVVLYGAGKFGRDLYRRLSGDGEHEIVLWADKNAEKCRMQGLGEVQDVSVVTRAEYDQVVIAVMDRDVASGIRRELEEQGIAPEKIIWLPVFQSPYQLAEWKSQGIG